MKYHNSFKRGLALTMLALLSLSAVTSASNMPLPSDETMASITVRDLRKHLSFLASDELGGRYTLSPSNRIAARYLASQLESYGYRGASQGGSFFQKLPLSYRSVDQTTSGITIDASGEKKEFKYGEDFASQTPVNSSLSGSLVFVGYGISSPKNNYDDYAGLDVKGKVVVSVTGAPESLKNVKLSEQEHSEDAALAHGAAALLTVAPPQYLMAWGQIKNFALREQASFPPRAAEAGKSFSSFLIGPGLIKAVAAAVGKDDSYLTAPGGKPLQPREIPATAQLTLKVDVKDAPVSQNVAGILEGSDPKLKDEYVVFSAHYDHLKTNDNGEVYNGADDDGSGTVAVLEIAQAFAVGPRPKRSILIIFHTGEEMGLLGSRYNTDYDPLVPLDKLVADFNIDMIGRSRTPDDTDSRDKELADKNTVYVIGADKLSSELNKISEQTNADTERLSLNYAYNDENHPQRFYYRSDHFNYAKHDIPIIFYFTGVHRDYHRTTDDIDKIDFDKMERITRMVFATGWRVANLNKRLVVDKKPAASAAAR